MVNNVFRIERCDICGKEIRSKFVGHSIYEMGPNEFEQNLVTMIMVGGNDGTRNWNMCVPCAKAIESAINSLSSTLQTAEDRKVVR